MICWIFSRPSLTGAGSNTFSLPRSRASVAAEKNSGYRQNSRIPGRSFGRASAYSSAASASFRASSNIASNTATARSRFSGTSSVSAVRPCALITVRGSQQLPRSRSSRMSRRMLVSWSARPNAAARGSSTDAFAAASREWSMKSPVSISPTVPAT